MRGKSCRRVLILLLTCLLCVEGSLTAYASETGNMMEAAGVSVQNKPQGMQGIDISEEAILAAEMTEDEFASRFSLDETDLVAAETEMEKELGISKPQAQEVSANSISANSISANTTEVSPDRATTYATLEDAAAYMRSKMVARKEEITVRVAGKDSAAKSVKKLMDKAFEYDINGKPNEGDYLYWHMKAYAWTSPKKNSDGTYTIRLWFEYRTTAEEERYVTKKINSIVSSLNLKSSSLNDYQKVRAIYDYIMSIVQYDTYHYEVDQSYNYMYTTYEALNSGYAVCQAYATLFYRLSEEAGISARVICGNDDSKGNPTHGWNIVKIGKYYYNLDATWDDADVPTHQYFLKNMKEFTGHQRNKVNDGSSFDKKFPTASVSYPIPEVDISKQMLNVANISGSLRLIDGTDYSLASGGKMKVIFFMNPNDCAVDWVKQFFARSEFRSASYDTLFVDIFDSYHLYDPNEVSPEIMMQAIMKLAQYPQAYNFSSDCQTGLSYRNQYASLAGYPSGCVSSMAVIDANNRLRYFGYPDEALAQMDNILNEISYKGTYGSVSALKASQTQNNQVKLTWNAYSGATAYRIYRKMGSGAYCCVGTTTASNYVDEMKPKNRYTYQVYALYGSKEIAKSAETSIATKVMLLKKGKTYKVDGYKYKVLKSTSSKKTVAFTGVTNKKLTKILIPSTVTINGMKYKVTEIGASALKNNKKVKTVSIGANVTKIGKQAFYKAKNLANIVVKTKSLKSVGAKALYGISKKAEIRVPSKKYSKYKKLFKGKGQKSSVKIKK